MRLRSPLSLLILAIAFVAIGCSSDISTVTVGDDTADAAAIDESAGVEAPVSEDSAPLDVGPSTTAPWDVTLNEYPLLQLLDVQPQGSGIGSASFVLVGADEKPVFSGSDDHPQFIVTIDAWYGKNNYIEFTIGTSNVELIDGQPDQVQCGNGWAGLSQVDDGRFLRTPNLPEVKGVDLVQAGAECIENLPIEFDSLFDGEFEFDVTQTGFLLSQVGEEPQQPVRFFKLDPPPSPEPNQTTTNAPATTELPSTTTTAAPTND